MQHTKNLKKQNVISAKSFVMSYIWFNFNQESKYWEKCFLEKILWANIFNGDFKNLNTPNYKP